MLWQGKAHRSNGDRNYQGLGEFSFPLSTLYCLRGVGLTHLELASCTGPLLQGWQHRAQHLLSAVLTQLLACCCCPSWPLCWLHPCSIWASYLKPPQVHLSEDFHSLQQLQNRHTLIFSKWSPYHCLLWAMPNIFWALLGYKQWSHAHNSLSLDLVSQVQLL